MSNRITLTVNGMGSDHCAGVVKKVIESFGSVQEAQTSFANREATIIFRNDDAELNEILKAIRNAGYDPVRPAGKTENTPTSVRLHIEDHRKAESVLRHKARLVATRIRELREQQQFSGDVLRTLREQSLFDEEDRDVAGARTSPGRSNATTTLVQESKTGDDSSRHAKPAELLRKDQACSGMACVAA